MEHKILILFFYSVHTDPCVNKVPFVRGTPASNSKGNWTNISFLQGSTRKKTERRLSSVGPLCCVYTARMDFCAETLIVLSKLLPLNLAWKETPLPFS